MCRAFQNKWLLLQEVAGFLAQRLYNTGLHFSINIFAENQYVYWVAPELSDDSEGNSRFAIFRIDMNSRTDETSATLRTAHGNVAGSRRQVRR
jgi:hypothetical protein